MPRWVVAEAPEQPEFSLRNAEPRGDEVGPEARVFPEPDTVDALLQVFEAAVGAVGRAVEVPRRHVAVGCEVRVDVDLHQRLGWPHRGFIHCRKL